MKESIIAMLEELKNEMVMIYVETRSPNDVGHCIAIIDRKIAHIKQEIQS